MLSGKPKNSVVALNAKVNTKTESPNEARIKKIRLVFLYCIAEPNITGSKGKEQGVRMVRIPAKKDVIAKIIILIC